ncbi:MAG: PD-(D/E)XK nuclease family protein, partial [Eubacterium sp.]|nr:PD-(D/E)XK nuclease family protein [Eubacterium sp.]
LPFFIDENISLGANPLAENIMAFLNMVRSGFGMEYVMRFLRTGLSPLSQSETDILENYIIASGKRGYNSFKDIWTYKPNKYMSDGALKKINDLREKFIDSIECAVNELKGQKKSIREYMQAVCRYMIDNRFYTRLLYRAELLAGADHASAQSDDASKTVSTPRSDVSDSDLMRAAEYERLYPAMMNVFDTMVDLMGDERVSLKEFTEILGAGISEGMMGFIPQSSHRIMIGDVERSRIGDAEYVFFLGNTDDIFPKGAGSAGILNEREREKIAESDIELAPGPAELYDRELFYMYRILTKPSRRLYLSYTKTNCRGESTRASYLIRRVSSLYKYPSHEKPGLVIIDDEADTSPEKKIGIDKGLRFFITGLHDDNIKNTPDWSLIADYYEKKVPSYNNIVSPEPVNKKEAGLSPETAKALYGDVITASVTRFETFFSCPYSHFLKHGLGLKERDEYTVKPFDRGNIYHNSFERLYKKMQADKLSWKHTEAKKIIALGESCFDEEVKQYHDSLFDKDKRTAHLMKRMRLIFGDIIGRMHTQMALGEFEQELSEFSFDVDADERLKLNGRIDRIDTCVIGNDRFIKILDYKSSAKTLDLELVREGIELQLFTYMKVALEADIFSDDKKNRPAAVLFQGIDEKESEWDEKYTDHDKYEYKTAHEVRPDGYSTEEAVPYLDSMMAAGNVNSIAIHARNKKDGTYYDDARVIPESEFLETIGQVSDKLVFGSREIYDGIIRANPFVYEKGHRDACAFCPYKNVCGMEARTKGLMAKII